MRIEGKNGWIETAKQPRPERIGDNRPDYNSSYILIGFDCEDGYWPDMQFGFMDVDDGVRQCWMIDFDTDVRAFDVLDDVKKIILDTNNAPAPTDQEVMIFDYLREKIK